MMKVILQKCDVLYTFIYIKQEKLSVKFYVRVIHQNIRCIYFLKYNYEFIKCTVYKFFHIPKFSRYTA